MQKLTSKQIAALRYIIFNAKDETQLTRQVLATLIDASNKMTKNVCITLVAGRQEFTSDMVESVAQGFHRLLSFDHGIHLNQILVAMGTRFCFSFHYGDFDSTRAGDPFNNDGQFAGFSKEQVSRPELVVEGLPCRYTFWLSRQEYSQRAIFIPVTLQQLEKIELSRPGLYPMSERHTLS